MELEGTFQNGVVVLDEANGLKDGDRVKVIHESKPKPGSIGEALAEFRGVVDNLPTDFAAQIDHYRLGTPKR